MADMGPVLSAVDEYGDQRHTEGAASRQSEVDALRAEFDAYRAANPEPTPEPEPTPAAAKIIGMSALPGDWNVRLAEVGPTGIKARRIFGNFTDDGRDRSSLIEQAIADGMMPVVSYKGTPTAANCDAVRGYLDSLGVTVTATWHHEPRGDMPVKAFRAGSLTFAQRVRTERVKVGPILNGWLLTSNLAEWDTWSDAALLDLWDFLGMDTYETDAYIPGDRVAPLVTWLAQKGHPTMPILVGEYNGRTGQSIADSGEDFLSCPQLWVACMWNATGTGTAQAIPLAGDRLGAFKATKADARVAR